MAVQILLLLSHISIVSPSILPWNLVASRTPKYQQQNILPVSHHWDFPDNRDDYVETLADKITKTEWLIPPSRDEKDGEADIEDLETESLNIKFVESSLKQIAEEITMLWNKLPRNIIDKVKIISKTIIVDAFYSFSNLYPGNETKTAEYPSFINYLSSLTDYLIDTSSSVFSGQNITDWNISIPQKTLGGSIKFNIKKLRTYRFFEDTAPYQEVVLPGFGIAQDYVNQIIEVVLNTITAWSYKDDPHSCGQKFLCSANKEVFSRGLLVPNTLTYLSSLIISFSSNSYMPSSGLVAARRGRKGEDCQELFPDCGLNL